MCRILGALALFCALGVLLASCGETGGPDDERGAGTGRTELDALPRPEGGELAGHILYVLYERDGCELRSLDLATMEDRSLGPLGAPCDVGIAYEFRASQDGRSVAWRREDRVVIRGPDGALLEIAAPRPRDGLPEGATAGPVFSPDSRSVGYCRASADGLVFEIVDVVDGTPQASLTGECRVALTERGPVELRDATVALGQETLQLDDPAGGVLRDPPYEVATDPAGTSITLVSHGVPEGRSATTAIVDVYDLDGRHISTHVLDDALQREGIVIRFEIERLAPGARAAEILWGCILQLAPFATGGRFSLYFGEKGDPVGIVGFAPDGQYAVMSRLALAPAGRGSLTESTPLELPPADGAVVLDTATFEPRWRLPIHTEILAWTD